MNQLIPNTVARWTTELGIRGLLLLAAFLVAWFIKPESLITHARCALFPVVLALVFFGWSHYVGNMVLISGGIDSDWCAHHEHGRGGLLLSVGAVLSVILILWKPYKIADKPKNLEPRDRG